MIYLTLPELLYVAARTLGSEPAVRDYGLLESALARPQATAFGSDAYPGLDAKAEAGVYQAKPARVFGFEEIAEAHQVMEAGQAGGKLVVTGA